MEDDLITPVILRDGIEEPLYFRVTDLKQWFYCRRVVYFQFIMPELRPKTYAMEEGALKHDALKHSRSVWRGLPAGKYRWNVMLRSERLHATGLADLIIETDEGLVPVDFKDSAKASAHFKMQVTTYGVMLAEMTGKPVPRGFVYLLPLRRAEEVRFSKATQRKIEKAFEEMMTSILTERMPEPPRSAAPCVACEFRRFCGDRF